MKKTTFKNVVFKFLLIFQIPAFLYVFIYSFSFFHFVSKTIYALSLDSYFFNDGIILPLCICIPLSFISTAIVCIFYRKETTVLFRVLSAVLLVWEIVSFFICSYAGSPGVSGFMVILNVISIAGFIVIAVILIKEYFKKKVASEGL